MVVTKNREELEAWLQGRPREVAIALAARSALRVLPLLSRSKEREGFRSNIVLPVFRSASLSWSATKDAAHEPGSTIMDATTFAEVDVTTMDAARAAAFALAAITVDLKRTVTFAAAAADSAAKAFTVAASIPFVRGAANAIVAFWPAVSDDATRLGGGAAASAIAGLPLWLDRPPVEWLWRDLKAYLLAAGEDWEVWTDWYEDRLQGRVRDEKRELAYVQIENALWDQGPAVVNAEIKRRIEEIEANEAPPIEAIPEQVSAATSFRTNQQGLIDIVPDPPLVDPLQQEVYAEVRAKAEDLLGFGPNQLGDLINPVARFLESLPEPIEDVSITRSWSCANTLRIRLKAHDLVAQNGELDPARLPPLVAEMLRDVVHTWNVFIIGDPRGRELDEIRLGPRELGSAKHVVTIAVPLVEAIQHSEGIATALAKEAVVEQAAAAANAPANVDGDQATELSRKTTGNFVIQFLRSAYALVRNEPSFVAKEVRAGIYRAAGAATYIHFSPGIFDFIEKNAEALKHFVDAAWHNPALTEIVNAIIQRLH